MKKLLLTIFTVIIGLYVNAQFAYRSVTSGNWNAIATWERYNPVNDTWSAATTGQIPGAQDSVFIQASQTVTLTQNQSCLNLAMQNAAGIKLALNDFTLEVGGTIGAFTNPVATFAFPLTYTATVNLAINNGTNGAGVIRFIGATRNIFNQGQWGANPANWNCEFALNNGSTGTLPGNFKAGRITIVSGTVFANNDFRPDGAAASTGDIIINSGATLRVNGSIARTGTATNTIDSIDIYGTLEMGGTPSNQNLSAVNFRVNNGGKFVKINNNALNTTITNRDWAIGSTLEYAGTANQTIGGEFPNTLAKVVINNTNGTVNFSGNRYITDTLIMTAGNISIATTDSLTLGVTKTGTLIYTSGTIVGKLNRYIASTTTGNILFPVGTANDYRPINANFVSAPMSSGNVSMFHIDSGANNQTITSFLDGTFNIDRISQSYWGGSINNGLLATNITLTCTLTGQTGILNASTTRVVGSSDNGASYGSLGGSHVNGSGVTAIRSGFQVNSPLNFRIHLGGNSISNPLPVNFKSFTATKSENGVNLKWITASESNNNLFEVQRSDNGAKYYNIALVKGSVNSNTATTYTFKDVDSKVGTYCYRLKQVDLNGAFEFSKTTCVEFEVVKNNTNEVVTTPNPFNDKLQVKYNSLSAVTVNIQILDLIGKVHHNINMQANKGETMFSLETDNLPMGIYFVRINNNGIVTTQRIVKK